MREIWKTWAAQKYKSRLEDIRLHLLKGEIVQAFDKVENVLIGMEKDSNERDDFHTVKRQRNLVGVGK